MRYLLPVALLTILALGGCGDERQTYSVVPDRQGHATTPDGLPAPIQGGAVAGPGERYYSMEQGDTLIKVARKFNVEVEWLIHRNRIEHHSQVKVGTQLIVPATATAPAGPAPAPEATYPAR